VKGGEDLLLTVTEPTLSLWDLLADLKSVTKGWLWQVKRKDPQGALLMTITGVFFFLDSSATFFILPPSLSIASGILVGTDQYLMSFCWYSSCCCYLPPLLFWSV